MLVIAFHIHLDNHNIFPCQKPQLNYTFKYYFITLGNVQRFQGLRYGHPHGGHIQPTIGGECITLLKTNFSLGTSRSGAIKDENNHLSQQESVSKKIKISYPHSVIPKSMRREFLGSPVVRALCFHSRGHRFNPWLTPLSMGFSRQEYWSGLPRPSPKQQYRRVLINYIISTEWSVI
ncbi:unnamed protein product [Rangifer tarandus platyrhynchus]|uniref:Uncharacterized protein n=2 Tax=Rangifer tarandus platyrhynchus TaxID=3082113 RepID=A0AC59ZGG5_RANTA|nr:unnamed protein product [Rangifer tarandus platyrhynchus]